jgi:competence protein ComEC
MFEQQIERTHTTTTHVFFDQKSCTAICPTPIAFGQAYLQVYHPLHDATDEHPTAEHDTDVVVKVSWKHQSILLTGDLNEQHEEDILSACTPPICTLHATLLQVPHHGSATGLTPDFLSAIHPSEAWICVGQPNPYGHPRREILQELTEAHIPTHRTDQEGRVHRILMEQYPP